MVATVELATLATLATRAPKPWGRPERRQLVPLLQR